MTPARIAYTAASGSAFITPIMRDLTDEYAVRGPIDGWPLPADLLWLEWCDQAAVDITSNSPKTCPIIVRLHSFELFTPWPRQVDWSKVDALVFVADHVRDYALDAFDINGPEIHVIPNGVDLDAFAPPPERTYGHRVAWVGDITHKKGPMLFAQAAKALHLIDSRFTFDIAGGWPDARWEAYLPRMLDELGQDAVRYWGKIPAEHMPEFYREVDFVLSTSPWESFQYAVAEGAACGCVPIVHDWAGASDTYPGYSTWLTVDDLRAFAKWLKGQEDYQKVMHAMGTHARSLIGSLYDRRIQMTRIRSLIAGVLEQSVPPKVSAVMIVKGDEPRTAKAIESVVPHVDEVNVMVDVRHGDYALDVAQSLGCRVFPRKPPQYHGCIDFAAARNWIADQASYDWVLVLDADEELERGETVRLALRDAEHRKCDAVAVDVLCYTDRGLAEQAKDVRLYRRSKAHYIHPVHNQLTGHSSVLGTDIRVHSTYVGGLKGKGSRQERSIPPLLAMWAEARAAMTPHTRTRRKVPLDRATHAAFFLARMYASAGDHEQVCKWAQRCRDLCPGAEFASPMWFWWAQSTAALGRPQEALSIAEEGLAHHPKHPDLLFWKFANVAGEWYDACQTGFIGTPMHSRQFAEHLKQAAKQLHLPITLEK